MEEPLGSCAQIVTPVETIEVKALRKSKSLQFELYLSPLRGMGMTLSIASGGSSTL